jgi:hypothetical protein
VEPSAAVAWTWYVTIGTTLTFVVGYASSFVFKRQSVASTAG